MSISWIIFCALKKNEYIFKHLFIIRLTGNIHLPQSLLVFFSAFSFLSFENFIIKIFKIKLSKKAHELKWIIEIKMKAAIKAEEDEELSWDDV